METNGSYELGLGDKNIVFWARMSKEFADAVTGALDSGAVHSVPTVPLVYLIDGGYLDMPIVKRPPKSGYRVPHWLPVVLNVGPHPRRAAR